MRRLSLLVSLVLALLGCPPHTPHGNGGGGSGGTGTAAQMDIGAACSVDADCDAANAELCVSGRCAGTDGSTCPDAIATCDASACVPGYVCGRDGVGSPVCQPAGDCYPCTTDADCAPWGHCSAGVCQDGAPDAGG